MLSRGHQRASSALLLQRRSPSVGLDDVHTPIAFILQGSALPGWGPVFPPAPVKPWQRYTVLRASILSPSAAAPAPTPTHGTQASCTSLPEMSQPCTWSRPRGSSWPCDAASSCPSRRWRCTRPTRPTRWSGSCWELGARRGGVSSLRPWDPAPPRPAPHSQHSSLTVHFSVSSVGSVHTEPSSGNCFTYLSRDRMPVPQEMLQGDQVIHSDMVHVEPSATRSGRRWASRDRPSKLPQGQKSTWSAGIQGDLGNWGWKPT